jgi:filamentous hemagglutinin
MKQLGVHDDLKGHSLLEEHLMKVAKDNKNISNTFEKEFREGGKGSFLIKESLFAGPSGKFAKFETGWEITNENTIRLTTIIPKL